MYSPFEVTSHNQDSYEVTLAKRNPIKLIEEQQNSTTEEAPANHSTQNPNPKQLNLNLTEHRKTEAQKGRSSSLVRTLALHAKGRRSESGSAHFL